jgi:hypothetical protein
METNANGGVLKVLLNRIKIFGCGKNTTYLYDVNDL